VLYYHLVEDRKHTYHAQEAFERKRISFVIR
jgi:hypothetical protein